MTDRNCRSSGARILFSPMAKIMMRSLRSYHEEHAESWSVLSRLLRGPALELAKRAYLTIPVRIEGAWQAYKKTA